jgi:hypothetical protein
MKINSAFIIATICICFVLLGIIYGIASYGTAVDWDSISGVILGIYLYFAYLMLSIFWDTPKTQIRYFQKNSLPEKEQKNYRNEVYEY